MAKPTIKKGIKFPKYDPSKKYEWSPKAEIVFSGQDFMNLFNTINEEVFTPTGTSIGNKMGLHSILQKKFEEYVELGIITEINLVDSK